MKRTIEFTKMHGAGNDYIYIYTPDYPIANPEKFSEEWSRPHFAIGSDGLILVGPSEVADFSMHIYNNDGSEAMMCGNGTRCVGKFVYDHKLTDKTTITLETLSGIKTINLRIEDGECTGATVDMGEAILANPQQLATEDGSMKEGRVEATDGTLYTGTFVCMGNPHFVIFIDDVEHFDLERYGRTMEFARIFPERCNIEFATVRPDGSIRMRVWERGSGITLACGTGACATAVAAALTGRSGRKSTIVMDGGELQIEWLENGHVMMTGPAATAFKGQIVVN